ncbi:hypothetical protein SELMODRAFT_402575 [Selaginella moellendorffii]|uniref:Pentatricopeptide repeat-containing protein n=1 Tax=Selaginella moellendorffii TaxID=88036 RepID=D8QR42_SELML|nr:hypothetical protein SELMODRAFT_402575 [Selaginella moellendorffii]
MAVTAFTPRKLAIRVAEQTGHQERRARKPDDTLPTSNSMNMLEAYIVNGKIKEGRAFFDGAGKRDVKTWNIMLLAYTRGLMDEAKELFKMAKDPAVHPWVTMIEGPWRQPSVFHSIEEENLESWSLMVSGLATKGKYAAAEACDARQSPSLRAWSPLASLCRTNEAASRRL